MHRSRLGAVVIDCQTDDLAAAARFWATALGYRVAAEQSDPRYVGLEGPQGEPRILVQRVDHPSRVHLDIESDDQAAEVARLEAAGAKRVGELKGWVVLEAPSGQRFCVVRPQRPDLAERGNVWNVD